MNNEKFPINSLPLCIRDAVDEVTSCVQAPQELVVTSALATVAIGCQGIIDVRAPTGQITPTSLFFLSIADSGERKSSVDKLFSQPIIDFQQQQSVLYQKKLQEYETGWPVWELEYKIVESQLKKAIKKGDNNRESLTVKLQALLKRKPAKPRGFKIIYADTTMAALLHGLYSQHPYAALMSSEASTILNGLSMDQLAHLNTLWDGGEITIDRKSEESFTLKNARLSVSLMIQNEPFQQFLQRKNGHARESGFMARMLVANPPSMQGYRMRITDTSPEKMASLQAFRLRIQEILVLAYRQEPNSRTVLGFSDQAKEVWYDFYLDGENWIKPYNQGNDIKDCVSKISNNAARMAALLHYFSGKLGCIDRESMQQACDICLWYNMEFKRLFAPKDDIMTAYELADLLYDWLWKRYRQHGWHQCRKKDIYSYGPSRLRKREALDLAIDQLVYQRKIFNFPYSKPAYIELVLNSWEQQAVLPAPQAPAPQVWAFRT